MSGGAKGLRGHILISHTHWDHIQGIPFFYPLFAPGNEWDIYGPKGLGQSLRETLAGQMQYTYFPVTLDQCRAKIRYHDLVEGTFDIDDIKVSTHYLSSRSDARLSVGGRRRMPVTTNRTRAYWQPATGGLLGKICDTPNSVSERPTKIGWGELSASPEPQDCLHTSCWLLQVRLQDGLGATGPPGTHTLWQFMACVSQPIVQVVNADADGSNWGGGGTNG